MVKIEQMKEVIEQMKEYDIVISSDINFLEQKEVLEEFEKDMTKKGINEEQIKDMVKNGAFMMLPSKMALAFEVKYGWNPNILWC